jgi:hypothetical protein
MTTAPATLAAAAAAVRCMAAAVSPSVTLAGCAVLEPMLHPSGGLVSPNRDQ